MSSIIQSRVARSKAAADRVAARVERKAGETRESRLEAARDYKRQAKALRRELVDKRGDPNVGPTSHTRRQRSDSGLQHMMNAGQITPEMRDAATEIELVFLAVCGSVMGRSQSYEPVSRGEPAPMTERAAVAHAKRYRPWADQLAREQKRGGRPALAVTIAIVIDDRGLKQAAQDHAMRKETAAFLVQRSLLLYAEISGSVRPGATVAFTRRQGETARAARVPIAA